MPKRKFYASLNDGKDISKWGQRCGCSRHLIIIIILTDFMFLSRCKAAFIVVCIVAWDGMPKMEADNAYRLLIHKLNKFGLPTTRRCATNENRTCACQGNEHFPLLILLSIVFSVHLPFAILVVHRLGSRDERSIIFVWLFVVNVLQRMQIRAIEDCAQISFVCEE